MVLDGLDRCRHANIFPALDRKTGYYCKDCSRPVHLSEPLPIHKKGDVVITTRHRPNELFVIVDDSNPNAYLLAHYEEPKRQFHTAEKYLTTAQIPDANTETVDTPLLTETLTTPTPIQGAEVLHSSVSTDELSVSSQESSVSTFGHGLKVVPSHGKRYFRYVAWEGHKVVRSIHIPGGNTYNGVARERAYRVKQAIKANKAMHEIEAMIMSWRRTYELA